MTESFIYHPINDTSNGVGADGLRVTTKTLTIPALSSSTTISTTWGYRRLYRGTLIASTTSYHISCKMSSVTISYKNSESDHDVSLYFMIMPSTAASATDITQNDGDSLISTYGSSSARTLYCGMSTYGTATISSFTGNTYIPTQLETTSFWVWIKGSRATTYTALSIESFSVTVEITESFNQ